MPLLKTPGMISLGGGMPNPSTFPFASLQFSTRDGHTLALTPSELNEALQYSPTPGLPALCEHFVSLQTREHRPQYKDWGVMVTCGSQVRLPRLYSLCVCVCVCVCECVCVCVCVCVFVCVLHFLFFECL